MNRQTQPIKFNFQNLNVPPSAVELEQAVLGALMLEQDTMDRIVGIIDEECFYQPIHREIYKAIQQLYANSKAIDLLTVYEALKGNDIFNNNGGISYLSSLTSRVASAIHVERHAMILREKLLKRQVITDCMELSQMAYSDDVDVADLLSDFANKSDKANDVSSTGADTIRVSTSVMDSLKSFEKRQINLKNGVTTGITTGLNSLDRITGKMQSGDYVIVAARASMGKTAFGLNLSVAAAKEGYNVVFVSLEMTAESITNRLLLHECTKIRPDILKNQIATDGEVRELNVSAGVIERLSITLIKNTSVSINTLKSRCRTLKKRGKLDILVVDYIQLMQGVEKSGNREQEISRISREIKKMALELSIPIVILSQLSREVERRDQKKPQLSDLRESGSLEQDSDVVILLNRPIYYGITDIEDERGNKISSRGVGVAYVAKNRNGNVGHILFKHNETMTKITDYEH